MLNYMNRHWSIARRLTIIAIIGCAPVLPMAYIAILDLRDKISFAESEQSGVKAIREVWSYLAADSDAERAMRAANVASALTDPGHVEEAHQLGLIRDDFERGAKGRDLVQHIAADNSLSLEPDATTYYLIDVAVLQKSNIDFTLGRIQKALPDSIRSNSASAELVSALSVLQNKLEEISRSRRFLNESPEGQAVVGRLAGAWGALDQLAQVLNPRTGEVNLQAVMGQFDGALLANESIGRVGSEALEALLSARIGELHSTLLWGAVWNLMVVIGAVTLSLLIGRKMSGNMKKQLRALDALSHQDENAEIACDGSTNEGAELTAALLRLKATIIERKRLALDAERQNDYYVREHERFMAAFKLASDKIAAGEFEHRITESVIKEYVDIVAETNRTAERLQQCDGERKRSAAEQDAAIEALGVALKRLAAGDLKIRINDDVASQFERMKEDFNSSVEQLENTIETVKESAEGIKSGTEEIAEASDDLARRTESQAASLEQTAAAVAEITDAIKKTADGATQANSVVSEAKSDAERGGHVVRQAIDAMAAIEKSSGQISQIIGVIDEIAFQTNLLALNAGVEAARAGETGRGFAVVASEVRALAQRSATAAKEIEGLIRASEKQVEDGVKLVCETGKSLESIGDRVSRIKGVVADIATRATEQANAITQVNTAIAQMDQVTQQNAAMVEEATAATRNLQSMSTDLFGLVERFETKSGRSEQIASARSRSRKGRETPIHKIQVPQPGGARGLQKVLANAGWEEF